MFKTTAVNTQSRERRSVVESRENGGGVERAAFLEDNLNERGSLVVELHKLESQIARLSEQISIAHRRRMMNLGGQIKPSQIESWEIQKARLKQQLLSVTNALSDLKEKRRRDIAAATEENKKRGARGKSFNEIFFEMAKESLAGPVFERVRLAAIHRYADQFDAAEALIQGGLGR